MRHASHKNAKASIKIDTNLETGIVRRTRTVAARREEMELKFKIEISDILIKNLLTTLLTGIKND